MESLSSYVIEEKRYPIEEVFAMIGEEHLSKSDAKFKKLGGSITVDGFDVHRVSLRYQTFYQKGTKCVCCGKEGTHFKLCGDPKTNRRHFNLFADDGALLTKDHIIPKSRGGADTVENMQPMCEECNVAKGNEYDGDDAAEKEYIYATAKDGRHMKFSDIKKAARYTAVRSGLRNLSKEECVFAGVSAVLKIQKALDNGESYMGYTWTKEMM